jgi:hypothetical protein
MFFKKNPYTGYRSPISFSTRSTTIEAVETQITSQFHYRNVTKKKIYNTDDKICQCS